MRIISLTGQAGTGKDTMADYLIHRYGFVKVSMPDPMKRIAKEVYDFSYEQLWGPSEARNAPDVRYPRPDGTFLTARMALQLLGHEWSRVCYPETWVKYLQRVVAKIEEGYFYSEEAGAYMKEGEKSSYAGVIVSSCRFENEIQAIKDMGGVTIRLVRPALHESSYLQLGVPGHATEVEQMNLPDSFFDMVLQVPEGKEAFYAAIDKTWQIIEDVKLKEAAR